MKPAPMISVLTMLWAIFAPAFPAQAEDLFFRPESLRPEKAVALHAQPGPTALFPTSGLTRNSVSALPGNPLPHLMNGSSQAASLRLSSGSLVVGYNVKTAGTSSGLTLDFEQGGLTGISSADLSPLAKLTVGLKGNALSVQVRFQDVQGKTWTVKLSGVSSSEQFWEIDLAPLGASGLDRTRIRAIHFFVEQADVPARKQTGSFSVRLSGWDAGKPAMPAFSVPPPEVTGYSMVRLQGTKEAYSSVYLNGKEAVPADASTTWSAIVKLKEGNNTVEILSKSALGIASSSQKIKIYYDTKPPKGSIRIKQTASTADSTTVTLALTASDNYPGDLMMSFRIDGGGMSEWEPFSPTKTLAVSSFGATQISYWIKDKVGNAEVYDVQFKALGAGTEKAITDSLAALLKEPEVVDSSTGWLFNQRAVFQYKWASYSNRERALILANLSPRDQALLRMLSATRQSVPVFITDAELENRADGRPGVSDGFKSSEFKSALAVLETLDPQTAAAFIGLLATPYYPEPNPWTSWASDSWALMVMDARYNEFARRTTLGKLMVREGVLPIRSRTRAYFTWSGHPDIWIDLPAVQIGDSDIPDLKRIRDTGIEPYRTWAAKALMEPRG